MPVADVNTSLRRWYDPEAREQVVEDVRTLIEFFKLIEADTRDGLANGASMMGQRTGSSPLIAGGGNKRVGFSKSLAALSPRKNLSTKNEGTCAPHLTSHTCTHASAGCCNFFD